MKNSNKPSYSLIIVLLIAIFGLLTYNLLTRSQASVKEAKDINNGRPAVANNPIPSVENRDIVLADITNQDHIQGPEDAPITIVEFSDSECPFCKRFHETMQQVVKANPDNVRWVYKHAPLDQLHSKARKEAQAMECAADLGGNKAFWAYTNRLFEITPSNNGLSDDQLPEIADYIGLNVEEFNDCLQSDRFKDEVQSDLEEAQAAGLKGTPYSVVVFEDTRLPINGAMSYSQVQAIIDSLLTNVK